MTKGIKNLIVGTVPFRRSTTLSTEIRKRQHGVSPYHRSMKWKRWLVGLLCICFIWYIIYLHFVRSTVLHGRKVHATVIRWYGADLAGIVQSYRLNYSSREIELFSPPARNPIVNMAKIRMYQHTQSDDKNGLWFCKQLDIKYLQNWHQK